MDIERLLATKDRRLLEISALQGDILGWWFISEVYTELFCRTAADLLEEPCLDDSLREDLESLAMVYRGGSVVIG
jgi:hypothetical protein